MATPESILSMSDEDVLNMVEPPVVEEQKEEEEVSDKEVPTEPSVEESEAPVSESDASVPVTEDKPAEVDTEAPVEKEVNITDKPEEESVTETEPDYKSEYSRIMAPFKANGKEIKLESPDDVIKLMQLGANYTKKMQALQPNIKVIKMLESNGLLDENKLNYLIDIHKKNPAAIQKVIKDSGIDPLDIDTEKEVEYTPTNHSIPDKDINFINALEDVATSSDEGNALVVSIDKTWDNVSKDAVYNEPELLNHLVNQKQSGIYDTIVNEIERQTVLGNLNNVPFIHAYNYIGSQLAKNNKLVPTKGKTVVATKAAVKDKGVSNNDKAKAASVTKTTPVKAKTNINPLNMSDDDFLKLYNKQA